MKVAVVGSGIAGMVSAYHLAAEHEVTLYEAEARLGGHTDTHAICVDDRTTAVDSGFIVCNDVNYPNLLSWFEELGVSTQPSDMSFGVRCLSTGLEYGTTGINAHS